jgi:hypothetical protein
MPIFLVYPLLLFSLFRLKIKKKKKEALHNIFAFSNNNPLIEHIAKKNTKHKEKK